MIDKEENRNVACMVIDWRAQQCDCAMDTLFPELRVVCVNWQQLSRTATMTLQLSQLRRSMCKVSCPDIGDTVRTVGT